MKLIRLKFKIQKNYFKNRQFVKNNNSQNLRIHLLHILFL